MDCRSKTLATVLLRGAAIALVPLLFSACQGPVAHRGRHSAAQGDATPMAAAGARSDNTLPAEAYTGYPGDGYTIPGQIAAHMRPPGFEPPRAVGPPLPARVYGPWAPPNIAKPWPEEEYLCDGGDHNGAVMVRDDWRLDGLNVEDTVAHFDTVDGRTLVAPSNQVCIYAPRFAAVRRVDSPYEDGHRVKAGGHAQPIALVGFTDEQLATTKMQPVPPLGDVGMRRVTIAKQKDVGVPVHQVLQPMAVQDRLKPHENFVYLRTGVMEEAEKPFIAKAAQAAIVWTNLQALQVMIDGKRAQAQLSVQRPQVTYRVDEPQNPKLQLCKIASTGSAAPGEEIDFTLRFDNVGDQTIGNVTIVDSLTTRLEYVEGSAQSSVKANFSVTPNEAESLVLRWEITEPLKPGDGGLVRFKCRVR